jgi:hypothetical protein
VQKEFIENSQGFILTHRLAWWYHFNLPLFAMIMGMKSKRSIIWNEWFDCKDFFALKVAPIEVNKQLWGSKRPAGQGLLAAPGLSFTIIQPHWFHRFSANCYDEVLELSDAGSAPSADQQSVRVPDE